LKVTFKVILYEKTDIIKRLFNSAALAKVEWRKILENKKALKTRIFEECYKASIKEPLLLIFEPKDGEARANFYQLLEGILVLPFKIIVIGDEAGDSIGCPAGKVAWFNAENGRLDTLLQEYMTAADMALVFDEHKDFLNSLFQKGVVVIGHDKSPLLNNYHPNEETGNSFTFDSLSPWDIFRALVRAQETYRFPYDWENIIRTTVKAVN